MYLALKVSDLDNVATIFAEGIMPGVEIEVKDKQGNIEVLKALDPIPYGHKIAVREIAPGEQITKYGEEIGLATKAIAAGSHVHVHNLDSMRGRGDLGEEEQG